MSHSRVRGIALTAAKALVSLGLIALLMRGMDTGTVFENLRKVDPLAVAFAAVVVTAISLLHARRWEIVLARMAHVVPYADALKLVLIGFFFNQTLPSTVGGDAYRMWGAYSLGIRAGDAVTSVIVDRVFALLALVLMIIAGSWWLLDLVRVPAARWVLLAAIVGSAAGMAVLLMLPRYATTLRRWRPTGYLVHVSEGARAVVTSANATLQVMLFTVVGYAAFSFAVYVLAQGMGVGLSLSHALLFVPLVTLITVLPVSIAGWGLRESSMVVTLGLIGVPSTQAFSLSVLFGLVVMSSGIPGGLIWLSRRRRPTHARAVQPESSGNP